VEPLLNIAWLILVVPAALLFRCGAGEGLPLRRPTRSLLLLGCLLALLFPVVSATDDVYALQRDVEEPIVTKFTAELSVSSKSPAFAISGGLPAHVPQVGFCLPTNEIHLLVLALQAIAPIEGVTRACCSRGPPC
jgi:hypothetical protein